MAVINYMTNQFKRDKRNYNAFNLTEIACDLLLCIVPCSHSKPHTKSLPQILASRRFLMNFPKKTQQIFKVKLNEKVIQYSIHSPQRRPTIGTKTQFRKIQLRIAGGWVRDKVFRFDCS